MTQAACDAAAGRCCRAKLGDSAADELLGRLLRLHETGDYQAYLQKSECELKKEANLSVEATVNGAKDGYPASNAETPILNDLHQSEVTDMDGKKNAKGQNPEHSNPEDSEEVAKDAAVEKERLAREAEEAARKEEEERQAREAEEATRKAEEERLAREAEEVARKEEEERLAREAEEGARKEEEERLAREAEEAARKEEEERQAREAEEATRKAEEERLAREAEEVARKEEEERLAREAEEGARKEEEERLAREAEEAARKEEEEELARKAKLEAIVSGRLEAREEASRMRWKIEEGEDSGDEALGVLSSLGRSMGTWASVAFIGFSFSMSSDPTVAGRQIASLCRRKGGIYVKAAQTASSMDYAFPKEVRLI